MFKTIQQFFEAQIRPEAQAPQRQDEHALQLATAALLIELMRADFKVEEAERNMVERAIQKVFDLTQEETEDLIRLAEEESQRSMSIYEFTHLVDRNFSMEKKIYIVELLWRVALSDAEIEQHEEYLIRKIAKLLHVYHDDFIGAKMRARKKEASSQSASATCPPKS
jgi:uncharacterized tellurite resistance protein B-like protein